VFLSWANSHFRYFVKCLSVTFPNGFVIDNKLTLFSNLSFGDALQFRYFSIINYRFAASNWILGVSFQTLKGFPPELLRGLAVLPITF